MRICWPLMSPRNHIAARYIGYIPTFRRRDRTEHTVFSDLCVSQDCRVAQPRRQNRREVDLLISPTEPASDTRTDRETESF